MKKNKELAKNTFVIFLGVFFTKIMQYFLLPIYTKYLTSAEYGSYELVNTIITLLFPLIGLQLDQGVFRFLVKERNNEKNKSKIISTSIFFTLIVYLLLFLIFIIISPYINYEYKWLLLINLFMTNISSVFNQISRGLGDNKSYSKSGFYISLFTITFNILFLVALNKRVDGLIMGGIIGYLFGIVYITYKLRLIKYINYKSIDKSILKKLLKYSIPLIPNSISWWLIASSDRMIVATKIGLSATGLLSIAYKFSNIGIILYNVFYLSISESLSLHIDDEDIKDYFNSIFNKISILFSLLLLLLTSFMPLMFNILIDNAYIESYNLIPVAIFASLFQILAGLYSTIYIAYNKTKAIAISSIIAAILNVVLDLILIQYIGLYAAVFSTLISFIILYIYRFIDINKNYIKLYLSKLLIISIVLLLLYCIVYYIDNKFIKLLSIISSIFLFIIFNKNYIIVLKNKMLERIKK